MDKPTTKEKAHQAPSTPGWQLLFDAARAATDNSDERARLALLVQLSARRRERIPKPHLMEVAVAVAAAACGCELKWDDIFTEFLDAQIGEEGLRKMLEGSGWEIWKCKCNPNGIGYHVFEIRPDPIKILRFFFQASIPVGLVVGTIFAPGATPGKPN